MALSTKSIIKFETGKDVRAGLEKIADFHCLGTNGASAHEVVKLWAPQIAKLKPELYFQALASLHEYQAKARSHRVPKRNVLDRI